MAALEHMWHTALNTLTFEFCEDVIRQALLHTRHVHFHLSVPLTNVVTRPLTLWLGWHWLTGHSRQKNNSALRLFLCCLDYEKQSSLWNDGFMLAGQEVCYIWLKYVFRPKIANEYSKIGSWRTITVSRLGRVLLLNHPNHFFLFFSLSKLINPQLSSAELFGLNVSGRWGSCRTRGMRKVNEGGLTNSCNQTWMPLRRVWTLRPKKGHKIKLERIQVKDLSRTD